MVRELLTDMALTITFSLLASLIVALTVVPCAGSTVLRTQKEVKHPLFDKLLDGYEKALRFCMKSRPCPWAGYRPGWCCRCGALPPWALS